MTSWHSSRMNPSINQNYNLKSNSYIACIPPLLSSIYWMVNRKVLKQEIKINVPLSKYSSDDSDHSTHEKMDENNPNQTLRDGHTDFRSTIVMHSI